MPGLTLLTVPWGFLGQSGQIEIDGPQAIQDVPTGGTPLVVVDSRLEVELNGRADMLVPEAEFSPRPGESRRLLSLPVPLHAGDRQALRLPGWREDAGITWAHGLSRPSRDETEGPGALQFLFLLALVGRLQDFEAALAESFLPWDHVLESWLEAGQARQPMMDILVRHARKHGSRWPDLVERPRRVLNRRREMVPLGRVEELDTRCMEWLSRQPGTTIAQRAGDRQRILALSRFENLNTLENRVHRDLLERTAAAARDYLKLYGNRQGRPDLPGRTGREGLVERYGRDCRRLAFELVSHGVGRESGPVQPNFVLLQDSRYRHVWQAWQEIVQRERVHDDLWRWQRRAWAEFCKAGCVVSLLAWPGTELVAASPIFFRPEHRDGEWLLHDDPLAIVANRRSNWIVEILRGGARDIGPGCAAFGASVWLRVSNLEGGEHHYLPVWAVHGQAEPMPLCSLVDSAAEAISENLKLARSNPRLTRISGGLVTQSLARPDAEVRSVSSGRVQGIAFGPYGDQLSDGLSCLGDGLIELIEAAP